LPIAAQATCAPQKCALLGGWFPIGRSSQGPITDKPPRIASDPISRELKNDDDQDDDYQHANDDADDASVVHLSLPSF
jgi:hypothetical protein